MEFYITVALLAAVIILLIILLVKQGKPKNDGTAEKLALLEDSVDDLSEGIKTEFERSRRETSATQAQMREENERMQDRMRQETTAALDTVKTKMEQLRVDNSDRQAKLEKAMTESLNSIKLDNAAQNEKQSKMMGEAVDRMRESNEKKLEEMRATVDEKLNTTLTTRLDSSFKTVSERLESVYKSLGEMKELSGGVTSNVTALNRILTNVKARGTWAEVQLGSILDQTIPGMYETNFASVEGSADRVEFAVKIPSGDGTCAYLPIDSKFPMEDYVRLCDAADEADAAALTAARKALEARVLNEAKTVAKYINVPLTTPYAILYLATEGLYAEIASSKNGIAEKIRAEYSIMIAGPSTITALLNSLSLGFRAVAINEKANEVRELLAAAKKQYDVFGDVLKKAHKKITEAGDTLGEAEHRNEIIRKKLRKVEEIDGGNADEILGINEISDD